jgi:hypothetical protein
MVKSPDVHLVIQRLHAKVEQKNIFIFSYKYYLGRLIINTKTIHNKRSTQ